MILNYLQKLQDAGLPVVNANDDGSASFSRPFTTIEQEKFNIIIMGWDYIRNKRNQLLAECDWTQILDAALSLDEKDLWSSYRQILRNIPQDYVDPLLVTWPKKPGE